MTAVIADNSPICIAHFEIFACSQLLAKVGFTALTYLSCLKLNDAGVEEFWLRQEAVSGCCWRGLHYTLLFILLLESVFFLLPKSLIMLSVTNVIPPPLGLFFVCHHCSIARKADYYSSSGSRAPVLEWWAHYFDTTLYGMTTAEPPLMPTIGRAVWVERKSRICATSATWRQNRQRK